MSAIRDHLARVIQKKVDGYGAVVWEDPEREYVDVAESVSPSDATFARWDGSWYALRRQLEELVDGPQPPRLVVYQPTETPADDPLAEVRQAGTILRHRLSTLVRDALAGAFTQNRIAELAKGSRTLLEVEAALSGGGEVGVRLPAALGSADTLELALRILADERLASDADEDLWGEASSFLRAQFGVPETAAGDETIEVAFRHLVVTELASAVGEPLPGLEKSTGDTDAAQRGRVCELLAAWRRDRLRLASYRKRAIALQSALALGETLDWHPAFETLDSVETLDDLALAEVTRRVTAEEVEEAAELAQLRHERSMWTDGQLPEAARWVPTWKAAVGVTTLLLELKRSHAADGSAGEVLAAYVRDGWRIDAAHRQMEEALTQLPSLGALDEPVRRARAAFEAWLDTQVRRLTNAVATEGFDLGKDLIAQTAIHDMFVADAVEPVAYFLVDALRYELGEELAVALRDMGATVALRAAVATSPTLTPVGMASLLPGAESGIAVALDPRRRVQVSIDGSPVAGVPPRIERLRAAHGPIADIPLNDIFEYTEGELQSRTQGVRIVLVRSQEIDEALETDKVAAARSYVRDVGTLVARGVARLRHAGISHAVIAADHGFVLLSGPVGPDRTIEPPGGEGELHRRCWIGRGGAASESSVRVPLADLGVGGDLDLVVPRGFGVFPAGGARRYFHGGLSPQELIIPVLDARFAAVAEQPGGLVAEVADGRIVTGVFSARVELKRNLFSETAVLRVIGIRKAPQGEVARAAAGNGFDATTGTITVDVEQPAIITLRVTASLKKGERVTLELYDARTDRLVATSGEARVVTDVRVDDELD